MASLKSLLAIPFSKYISWKIKRWSLNPVKTQNKIFEELIRSAASTKFGQDHGFTSITSYESFKKNVPIRDYEDLKHYIDSMVSGKEDILWPGKPLFLAKTSGTTSGVKYIPITKESMPSHTEAARNAILMYIAETGKSQFVDGKMIFLQGSPILEEKNGMKLGRLSGIVAHYVPNYLQRNRLPSWETNCIGDWEEKVNKIVKETVTENMTVISGIPSWVQMYFEKIINTTGKRVGDVFKNFELFIFGGVNFEPYKAKFESLIGRKVDSIELYPASEGFFAFQDVQNNQGMLLQLNSGIFYEFVIADSFFDEDPKRISIGEVKLDVNYVMIISSNAGLWAYNVGDTIMFTSLKPYRVIVTGRIKHFISAFGEHVIGKEVEESIKIASEKHDVQISEFSVAPQINPDRGLPYHEWFIEFEKEPEDIEQFGLDMDEVLQQQNKYYYDLISGKILRPLIITKVKKDGFNIHMKSIGKLGAQNKIPRLANDRKIADNLIEKNLTY